MATSMPISPARTPRRAVEGWLIHISARMNSDDATIAAKGTNAFISLPPRLEHLEHAVGDHETADRIDRGAEHRDEAQILRQRHRAFLSRDGQRAADHTRASG